MMMRSSFSQIVILALFLVIEITLSLAFAVGMITLYEFVIIFTAVAIFCAFLYTILRRKS